MAYPVRIADRAKRDLDEILDWLLAQQSGAAGWRWFEGLREAVASLAESPRRCRLAPEDAALPFEVRQLLYGNRPHVYRILFTIEQETVTVLHVRHGRRLPLRGK